MKTVRTVATFLAFIATGDLYAQDNHRWTNQFGARSSLLGGAVIGGVRDSSATFYNPGALGFLKDSSVSVNANAIRLESIDRDNAVADDVGFSSEELEAVPLMVSGVFIGEQAPDLVVGYSLLTKNSSNFSATERLDAVADTVTVPEFPGVEDTILQASQHSELREYWGGLGLGYRLSDTFALGFTNFLALRTQEANGANQVRAVNQETLSLSSIDTTESYDIWNLRALWKVGVAGSWDWLHSGITDTTPSVSIAGDGTSFRDFTANNFDLDGSGETSSFVASDRQDDLDAEYRTPFSIGWGVQADLLETTRIGAAAEWFGGVGRYSVLSPEARPFLRPQGAFPGLETAEFLRVVDAADDVVNFSVGIEQELSEVVTGYLAVRSDFETFQPTETNGRRLGFSNYDLWHVTTGLAYRRQRSTVAVGFEYSFGDSDELGSASQQIENEYEGISILLGYTYHFGDLVS